MRRLAVAAALLLVVSAAAAHHSTAAYGRQDPITLEGVVAEFRWTSPHVYIDVAVPGAGGEIITWSVEAGAPQLLATTGWSPTALAPRDRVVVIATPARDTGSRTALATSVRKADGTLLAMPGDTREVSAAVSLSAPQSSCPRVEMTEIETRSSAETRAVGLGGETVHVRRSAITTTSDIAEIAITGDDALASIQITYRPEAADRMFAATSNSDGLRLAFVVDDEVWLAFTWQGPYGIGPGGTQISLENGMDRAQGLVQSIRECNEE